DMGRPGSWISYGPQWAEAGSAPFSRYKTYATEGGIVTPLIIAGPDVQVGEVHRRYATVMDLAPTFLELAGQAYPSDGSVQPMLGESLRPVLTGDASSAHSDEYVTALYYEGRAFIRQGAWKLVNVEPPFSESDFQLHNLSDDPGEAADLRQSHPEKHRQLLELWNRTRRELGILLPVDL
ncbi:MAG: arylsulfatase, partial [Gammaproteobacteria bacterium]